MDGIILIDKPAGVSSAEAVRRVKALVKPARVGHLGTLDPFATGLLPIMIGQATRLAPFLQQGEKHYEGLIRLGAETDTLDPTGAVIRSAPAPQLDRARLDETAARFTGLIEQVPPVFSAIKRAGVRFYELARRGDELAPPPPRRVHVRRLELAADGASSLRFSVQCSSGTYVRSLARDIGLALGSAAHLEELRRVGSGQFVIEAARPLDQSLAILRERGEAGVIGMREALEIPEVSVDAVLERRLRNGDWRALEGLVPAGASIFKVIYAGRLIAIARAESGISTRLLRVFRDTPA